MDFPTENYIIWIVWRFSCVFLKKTQNKRKLLTFAEFIGLKKPTKNKRSTKKKTNWDWKITHLNKMKPIDVTAARRTSSFTSETWERLNKKNKKKIEHLNTFYQYGLLLWIHQNQKYFVQLSKLAKSLLGQNQSFSISQSDNTRPMWNVATLPS